MRKENSMPFRQVPNRNNSPINTISYGEVRDINVVGIALDELYRIFGVLNEEYFGNKLEPPVITIQKSKSNVLGHCTTEKVWRQKDNGEDDDSACYEININPLHLNAPVEKIIGTLQHEIVHYANNVYGIKDCSGQHHNKKFKDLAERVGLLVEKSDKVGWGITEPDDRLLSFIKNAIQPDETAFAYFRTDIINQNDKPKKPKNIFKYRCPDCDLEVKAKAGRHIMCGDCKKELEMEEDDE